MAKTLSYSLLSIDQINNNGFVLELPQSAVDMVNKISDIVGATKEGVVYPSMDPSCFEMKFPNIDIEVRVVGDSLGGGNY